MNAIKKSLLTLLVVIMAAVAVPFFGTPALAEEKEPCMDQKGSGTYDDPYLAEAIPLGTVLWCNGTFTSDYITTELESGLFTAVNNETHELYFCEIKDDRPGFKYYYHAKGDKSFFLSVDGGYRMIENGPRAHDLEPATCTRKATCKLCGKEVGELKDHDFGTPDNVSYNCNVCGAPIPCVELMGDGSYDNPYIMETLPMGMVLDKKFGDYMATNLDSGLYVAINKSTNEMYFSVTQEKKAGFEYYRYEKGYKNCFMSTETGYRLANGVRNHTGGTATCSNQAVCDYCGQSYGPLEEHEYDEATWKSDGKNHWTECSVCGDKKDVTAHTGGTATCTAKAVCDICGQEYGSLKAHKYSDTWKTNADKHWKECSACGAKKSLAAHKLSTATTTQATMTANGKKETKCSVCGKVTKTATIYAAKTVSLAQTTYTYDGTAKKPAVTVKDSKGNAIPAANYTVTYPTGRKNVGEYTVKVAFKGDYKGSRNLKFTINPAKTSLNSLAAGSKAFTAKWTALTTQATGYELQYSTSSTFASGNKTVTMTAAKTASKTVSSLKASTKYYVRIRTYKTVSGTKYYADWSAKKSVTTKK